MALFKQKLLVVGLACLSQEASGARDERQDDGQAITVAPVTPGAEHTTIHACPATQTAGLLDCPQLKLAALPAEEEEDDDDEAVATSTFTVIASKSTVVVPVVVPTDVTAPRPVVEPQLKRRNPPEDSPGDNGGDNQPPPTKKKGDNGGNNQPTPTEKKGDNGDDAGPAVTGFEYSNSRKLQAAKKAMEAALKEGGDGGDNGGDNGGNDGEGDGGNNGGDDDGPAKGFEKKCEKLGNSKFFPEDAKPMIQAFCAHGGHDQNDKRDGPPAFGRPNIKVQAKGLERKECGGVKFKPQKDDDQKKDCKKALMKIVDGCDTKKDGDKPWKAGGSLTHGCFKYTIEGHVALHPDG